MFHLFNVASTDLAPFADTLFTADDTSSFPDGMATNEGNVSPVNTHSEHSSADSKADGNRNMHLSSTTADMHFDSRVVIPIISDSKNDSANQSPQPPL